MSKYTEEQLVQLQKYLEAEKANMLEEKRQMQEQRVQIVKESQELNKLKSQNTLVGSVQGQNLNTVTCMTRTIGLMREFKPTEDFEV